MSNICQKKATQWKDLKNRFFGVRFVFYLLTVIGFSPNASAQIPEFRCLQLVGNTDPKIGKAFSRKHAVVKGKNANREGYYIIGRKRVFFVLSTQNPSKWTTVPPPGAFDALGEDARTAIKTAVRARIESVFNQSESTRNARVTFLETATKRVDANKAEYTEEHDSKLSPFQGALLSVLVAPLLGSAGSSLGPAVSTGTAKVTGVESQKKYAEKKRKLFEFLVKLRKSYTLPPQTVKDLDHIEKNMEPLLDSRLLSPADPQREKDYRANISDYSKKLSTYLKSGAKIDTFTHLGLLSCEALGDDEITKLASAQRAKFDSEGTPPTGDSNPTGRKGDF